MIETILISSKLRLDDKLMMFSTSVYEHTSRKKKIIAFLVLISQSNDVIILVVPVKGALTLELVEDKQDEQH